MSRAPWVAHFGLARTPFSKSIAAKDLFARAAHGEGASTTSPAAAAQEGTGP